MCICQRINYWRIEGPPSTVPGANTTEVPPEPRAATKATQRSPEIPIPKISFAHSARSSDSSQSFCRKAPRPTGVRAPFSVISDSACACHRLFNCSRAASNSPPFSLSLRINIHPRSLLPFFSSSSSSNALDLRVGLTSSSTISPPRTPHTRFIPATIARLPLLTLPHPSEDLQTCHHAGNQTGPGQCHPLAGHGLHEPPPLHGHCHRLAFGQKGKHGQRLLAGPPARSSRGC